MKRVLAVLGMCAFGGVAAADRHEVTGATFEAPAGWEVHDSPDHATMLYKVDDRFAIMVVFAAHAPAGDIAATFAADWTAATANTPTPTVPKPAARKLAGRSVLEASAEPTSDGQKVFVDLIQLASGGQVVSTLIYTQDRKMMQGFQATLEKTVASIQVAPAAKPEPPPVANPAPGPPPPDSSGARKLTSITLDDIAGSWDTHDLSVSVGDATSVQNWYQIKPDGAYERQFQGIANHHVVRETGKGKITLTPDAIVFTEDNREYKNLRFLELRIDADGTAHWKLLDSSYPPTDGNIALYAENWIRAVGKSK